jgi:hypothetical protein
MLRIRVDFNSLSMDGEKVQINTIFQPSLLDQIYPGLKVILFEPNDMHVEAEIELEVLNDGSEIWWGVADWTTRQDL